MTSNRPIKNINKTFPLSSVSKKLSIKGVPVTIEEKNTILQLLLQHVLKPVEKSKKVNDFTNQQHTSLSAEDALASSLRMTTPNPEQIVYAQSHIWYKSLLQQSEISLPDGVGDVLAIQLLYQQSIQRIAGVDMMKDLISDASKYDLCIAYLGGKAGSAKKVLTMMHDEFRFSHGWSDELPQFTIDEEQGMLSLSEHTLDLSSVVGAIAQKIIKEHTCIVFIALGAPKQELFMSELTKALHKLDPYTPRILMAVGGSFEILSEVTPRAPTFMQQVGGEWLWRLLKEPSRWKRQLQLLTFVGLIIGEKLHPDSDAV